MLFTVHFKILENKIQVKQLVKKGTAWDIKGGVKNGGRLTSQVSKKFV